MSNERTADQQHRVGTVVGAHPGKLLEAHPAGRTRPSGREPAKRRAKPRREARALVAGEREAAADVGEHRDVRTRDAKQRPEQQSGLDAMLPRRKVAPGEGGVRHERQVVIACKGSGRAEPGDEGAGEHAGEPQPRHVLEPAGERRQGTGDVGEVQAAASGLLVRAVHRIGALPDPVLERLESVNEILIVLDDVAAAAREGARHLHEPRERYAPRLECSGEQRTAVYAAQRPHPGDAVPRSVEVGEHAAGDGEIHKPYAGHHRDVAEHEVDERRHAARLDHRGVVAQDGSSGACRALVDPLDLADDAGGKALRIHQLLRHLHRLFQGDGGRKGVRRSLGIVELVGRDDSVAGHHGRLGHETLDMQREQSWYVLELSAATAPRIDAATGRQSGGHVSRSAGGGAGSLEGPVPDDVGGEPLLPGDFRRQRILLRGIQLVAAHPDPGAAPSLGRLQAWVVYGIAVFRWV